MDSSGERWVLFFIEPVVYRQNPLFLEPHLRWARAIANILAGRGLRLCVVSNSSICNAWRERYAADGQNAAIEVLNSVELLLSSESRQQYSKICFTGQGSDNLLQSLLDIRRRYNPIAALASSENAAFGAAFGYVALYIEQPPLPRRDQPERLFFDPLGHQSKNLLGFAAHHREQIRLTERQLRDAQVLLQRIANVLVEPGESAHYGRSAIAHIKKEGVKVALLALQPPDWVAMEGAGGREPEALLKAWSDSLPAGWVGVATYHRDWRLNEEVERLLTAETSKLRFLPTWFGHGTTENLLVEADGLVTVSSTAAVTALLVGKPTVVTGDVSVAAWAGRSVGELAEEAILSDEDRARLVVLLTHRFTERLDSLGHESGALQARLSGQDQALDPVSLLEMDGWSAERANALFGFT